MLHARGQSTAVLQQQHVDRLHRHTIHTTSSAGMAHANGPAARCHFFTCPFFFAATTKCLYKRSLFFTTSAHAGIDFVCVLCTSGSTTTAVASLSFPLSLSFFVQGYLTQQYRHISTYYPFIFSQLQRSVCTNGIHSLLPFWHVLFFDLYHGPNYWHTVICDKLTCFPLTRGCSEGLGAFRFFFK